MVADTSGMAPHPQLPARATPGSQLLRVLAFAPNSPHEEWIVTELSRLDVMLQIERNVVNVIAALVEDPPPRPAVLVVDFDSISSGALLQLHAIREHGWCGALVGVGLVPLPLRTSLGIDRVLALPARDGELAHLVGTVNFTSQTVRIPVCRDTGAMVPFQARSLHVRVSVKRR